MDKEKLVDNLKVTSQMLNMKLKKSDNFDKKQKREFTTKVLSYYESKLNDVRKNEETEKGLRIFRKKIL